MQPFHTRHVQQIKSRNPYLSATEGSEAAEGLTWERKREEEGKEVACRRCEYPRAFNFVRGEAGPSRIDPRNYSKI